LIQDNNFQLREIGTLKSIEKSKYDEFDTVQCIKVIQGMEAENGTLEITNLKNDQITKIPILNSNYVSISYQLNPNRGFHPKIQIQTQNQFDQIQCLQLCSNDYFIDPFTATDVTVLNPNQIDLEVPSNDIKATFHLASIQFINNFSIPLHMRYQPVNTENPEILYEKVNIWNPICFKESNNFKWDQILFNTKQDLWQNHQIEFYEPNDQLNIDLPIGNTARDGFIINIVLPLVIFTSIIISFWNQINPYKLKKVKQN
jgi:hypothetical protein